MSNYKKVEAILYSYERNKAEINHLLLEIESLENGLGDLNGIEYSDMPKGPSSPVSAIESEIEHKESKILFLRKLIKQKEISIKKVDNAMTILDEREQTLVKKRYFDNVANSEVARVLNLQEEWTSKLKRRTVKKIEDLLFCVK